MSLPAELFLLIDSDHHRDDIYELFLTPEAAIERAREAVKEASAGGNRRDYVEDQFKERMRADGWLFLTTIGEDGDGVSVRKVRLSP